MWHQNGLTKQGEPVSAKPQMELEKSLAEPATLSETRKQIVKESIFVVLPKKPLNEITGLDVPRGVDPDLLAIECDRS